MKKKKGFDLYAETAIFFGGILFLSVMGILGILL